MRRKYYYLFFTFLSTLYCFAQQDSTQVKSNNSNPIIYGDIMLGGSGGEVKGLTIGFDLNFQINKDLITLRSNYIIDKNDDVGFAAILIFPIYIGGDSTYEYALLYGKRFIFEGSALSFSIGISSNLVKYKEIINDEKFKRRKSYIGIPFEVNFNFFKNVKKRYRIVYGLIPVGKPTVFGRSIGFKFFGNFGKFNYFGFGINYGFGWHKKY